MTAEPIHCARRARFAETKLARSCRARPRFAAPELRASMIRKARAAANEFETSEGCATPAESPAASGLRDRKNYPAARCATRRATQSNYRPHLAPCRFAAL